MICPLQQKMSSGSPECDAEVLPNLPGRLVRYISCCMGVKLGPSQ
jgi:hypothetical protein